MDAPACSPLARAAGALLLCLGTVPFLVALAAHAAGPVPQPSVPGVERGALAFDQYLVNLGPIPPGPYAYARYGFTNVSSRTVEVKRLETSCGCLTPRLEKRVYQPGESGEFFLQVQTAGEPAGPRQYVVKVHYTTGADAGHESELRQIDLLFKVVLPSDQVVVRPRALAFYRLGSAPDAPASEADEQILTVTDFRSRKLRIVGVESSSSLLAARLGRAREDADGGLHMPVLVTAAEQIPRGRHEAVVTIRTDDPAYPELRVPIFLHGR